MKNFFLFLLALLAGATVVSSCSNDDIEIGVATTFNIRIDDVVSSFIEYEDGELTTISSNYKIRTRLFLYDAKGDLAVQDVQYLSNYAAKSKMELFVPAGTYTAIAMTDVVRITSSQVSLQYWELCDSTRLSTARIQDAGYIGGNRKILGIDSKQLNITGQEGDISFVPKPAGALLLCDINNWNAYSDYVIYGWETNRSCDYCTFEQNGGYNPSISASDNFSWYLSQSTVDNSYNGTYGYYFVFPMKNAKFRFYCQSADGKQYYFGSSEITIPNIEAGGEFYFVATLSDPDNNFNDSFDYYDLETTRAGFRPFKCGENSAKSIDITDQKCVLLQDLISIEQE